MKTPHSPAFSYATVESALSRAFGIDEALRGSLRGRIKNFQALGITPSSPGTGKRISYLRDDIYKWAFCLELLEFGIDPKNVKRIHDYYWKNINTSFYLNEGEGDIFFHFSPSFLSDRRSDDFNSSFRFMIGTGDDVKAFVYEVRKNFGDEIVTTLSENAFMSRHGSINISYLRRKVEKALAHVLE